LASSLVLSLSLRPSRLSSNLYDTVFFSFILKSQPAPDMVHSFPVEVVPILQHPPLPWVISDTSSSVGFIDLWSWFFM
jgi:hypothetical protein